MSITLGKIIALADEIKPNDFSEQAKTEWINEVEGMVQTEVWLAAVEEVISYSYEANKDTVLLVEAPHSKIYEAYLTARIDYANGEYKKYQNSMQMFNQWYREYMRWYAMRYRPADRNAEPWKGYYFSAYGIAVKHGFQGSEQQWMESKDVQLRYDTEARQLQWKLRKESQWSVLMAISDLQGEVIAQTLGAAENAADSAQAAASEAAESAREAGEAAKNAVREAKDSGEFDGPPGEDGMNPYEYAIQNGYGYAESTFIMDFLAALSGENGGGSDVLVGEYESTFNDYKQAILAEKAVFHRDNNGLLYLASSYDSTQVNFFCIDKDGQIRCAVLTSENEWTYYTVEASNVFIGDETTTLAEFYEAYRNKKACFMIRPMGGSGNIMWTAHNVSGSYAHFFTITSTGSIDYGYLSSTGNWSVRTAQNADLTGYATEEWVKGYALPSTYTPPNQTAAQVGADPSGTAAGAVAEHNTDTDSHADLRLELKALTDRLNAFFDSDNQTLDELSEIVAYITSNKALIDAITTSKVSVADIINNLTTNVVNKPLSAAQGVVLKSLVDGLQSGKLDASALTAAINTALAQAKNSGEFDGEPGNGIKSAVLNADYTLTLTFDDGSTYTTPSIRGATGRRGTGLLPITTAPSSYTTAVNGLTPTYRISLSTVKTQASATEVYAGDTIRYSYYHYPVIYVDASYVYCGARVSVRGATGAAGKDYSFDPTVYGLPVLHLTGDISPIAVSKDNKVTLSYVYGERSGSCTLKGQGATSYKTAQALGDKGKYNYTINFDTAFEAKSGWGAQKKYCLKANFIDHTHSRNIVNATIWGKFTKERAGVPSAISALHHAGAIDGFPIVIMLNGAFHGLYTFNIPKDGWMFGLVEDTSKTQALVGANEHTAATQFKSEVAGDESDFEIEFVSDKNNSAWVNASLNRLINACINSWGGDLDTTVAQYLDWGSAIDYYIFTVLINGTDMTDKNYLLVTLDGTKWYFSAYDMDSTYGLEWDGSTTYRPNTGVTFASHAEVNRVMELIKRFKTNELKARYAELREGRLSVYRFYQEFENFAWAIPSPVLLEDAKRWSAIPGTYVNNIDSILRWIDKRLEVCDKWMDELPAQETPVAPVTVKNWVEYAEDTAAGSLYNGCGYKDDTRLSSSGGVSSSAQTGSVTVGFIPFKVTDVIRMKGAIWKGLKASVDGHYYIMFYNAEKTKIEGTNPDDWAGYMSNSMSVDYDETTGTTTFDVLPGNALANALANVAYFRINAKGKGSDLIITINQEIT